MFFIRSDSLPPADSQSCAAACRNSVRMQVAQPGEATAPGEHLRHTAVAERAAAALG